MAISANTFPQSSPKSLYWRSLEGGHGNAGMRPERRSRAGMAGGASRPRPQPFWRESDKTRGREGRGLAVGKPLFLRCRCGLGAPTSWATLEHVAVMEQTVEHGADRGDIAQQFAPVFHRTVRRQQRAGALVAPHHEFQQI